MRAAKGPGTDSRCARTCAICRRASQRRTRSDADSTSTKRAVKAAAVTVGGRRRATGVRQSGRFNSTPPLMPQDANHLIWIDMEMTGLVPDRDRIIEVALVITDNNLATVAEAPVWVVHQDDAVLEGMDSWNQGTHGKSGLISRVKASTDDEAAVEEQALAFLRQHVPAKASPMCGNSICQDRRFLARWMPQLEDWFHYRNLDVSTLKELCRRWKPDLMKGIPKEGRHEALADVHESIVEMKYYREHLLRP
ncbi:MAG: oligoribonuclease [Burkholderiales bacterium]|nr:oligoribonuclease [Burkholderiales bacterium]